MPANRTWPPPVEIGTKRSRATALRTVQGATTTTSPGEQDRRLRKQRASANREHRRWRETTSSTGSEIARYSGRTSASAPSSSPGRATSADARPLLSARRPEHRQHRAREQRRRQRLAHQHPLVLEQRRVDRDRAPRRSARRAGAARGGGRSGRRRGPRASRSGRGRGGRGVRGRRRVSLVEAADEQRQAGGVVARRLGRARRRA